MEELKSLFGDSSLTYEQLEEKLAGAEDTILLANLRTGKYVDKDKFDKQAKKLEEYESQKNLGSQETTTEDANTEYASLKAQYDDISTKYNELLAKQEMAEKMGLVEKANVDSKFAEFVYSKVNASEGGKEDFQKALSEFLKENSQYLNASKGTFVDLQNGGTAPKGGNDLMNKLIRGK